MCNVLPSFSHGYLLNILIAAVFVIAIGLSFLKQVHGDTYSTMMGPKSTANLRINISQLLIPIGNITGIVLGK